MQSDRVCCDGSSSQASSEFVSGTPGRDAGGEKSIEETTTVHCSCHFSSSWDSREEADLVSDGELLSDLVLVHRAGLTGREARGNFYWRAPMNT